MFSKSFVRRRHAFGLAATLTFALVSISPARAANGELARYKKAEEIATAHIAKFDRLDFDAFTNQKWDLFKECHSADIAVHWPDGHVTHGLERHIADLKAMFVYAPDTRIQEHPVKIANGEWTSVIGIMEGTFTKPMPIGEGKTIPPTGKAFKLVMCTVGHWKNGTMDQEYLFWDNQSYMAQIGLGK
jgi:hypothetical protein